MQSQDSHRDRRFVDEIKALSLLEIYKNRGTLHYGRKIPLPEEVLEE